MMNYEMHYSNLSNKSEEAIIRRKGYKKERIAKNNPNAPTQEWSFSYVTFFGLN